MDRKRSPGKPPPEHQCQGTSKRSGNQCEKWKMRGKNYCHIHGGKTPSGVGLPQFDHGRYSVSVPARLSQSYEETLNDPKRLELDNELALLISRNQELLQSLYSGESNGLWKRLRSYKGAMEKARRDGDADAADEYLNTIMRLIERGADDGERWAELMKNVDQQRRLAESERKRLVDAHQMVTTEELMAFMGAVLGILKKHVRDQSVLRAIGYDIEALVNGETNGKMKPGEDETGERS